MVVLGITAYYHDSSAALIVNGQIVAGALEERFSRKKHDNRFPILAIQFCMEYAGISLDDVDIITFYEKPFRKFERIIKDSIVYAPKSYDRFLKSVPIWLKERLNMRKTIKKELKEVYSRVKADIRFVDHHLAHAANAYFLSPYQDAAILVLDAVGEDSTTSIYSVSNDKITLIQQQIYPNSIGLLYSAFTYFLGFKVNSDEYKVMGLAPYGNKNSEETNRFVSIIKDNLVEIHEDGGIVLNTKYFSFMYSDKMVNDKKWERLFGLSKRDVGEEITISHKNLALAIQLITEEIFCKLAVTIKNIVGKTNLCISGGCALNCAANGVLLKTHLFDNIYVPYAPDDSGCAIGAALVCSSLMNGKIEDTSFIGPEYDDKRIVAAIEYNGLIYKHLKDAELCDKVTELLHEGKVVGWYQGRMEFGPRALGNRSILADPRNTEMKDKINSKIKFREEFRPFAPVVLDKYADEIMELHGTESEHMMFTYTMKKKGFDAVTHEDMSARTQILHREYNNKLYKLLEAFYEKTECPMLLNTSFNVMGEPIVCTPEDAIRTYLNSGLDALVIGNNLIKK